MSALEGIVSKHNEIYQLAQKMEYATANYRENVTLIIEEKNRNLVMFCKTFFNKYLLEHFLFEETVLFPVIKSKSLDTIKRR